MRGRVRRSGKREVGLLGGEVQHADRSRWCTRSSMEDLARHAATRRAQGAAHALVQNGCWPASTCTRTDGEAAGPVTSWPAGALGEHVFGHLRHLASIRRRALAGGVDTATRPSAIGGEPQGGRVHVDELVAERPPRTGCWLIRRRASEPPRRGRLVGDGRARRPATRLRGRRDRRAGRGGWSGPGSRPLQGSCTAHRDDWHPVRHRLDDGEWKPLREARSTRGTFKAGSSGAMLLRYRRTAGSGRPDPSRATSLLGVWAAQLLVAEPDHVGVMGARVRRIRPHSTSELVLLHLRAVLLVPTTLARRGDPERAAGAGPGWSRRPWGWIRWG